MSQVGTAPAQDRSAAVQTVPAKSAEKQLGHVPIGQMAKTTVGPATAPPSGQAILTLTASAQIAKPNQPIQFTLRWDRPVYRVAYSFEWGDKTGPEERTDPTAEHAYSSPGSYTVRVTAHSVIKAAEAGDPTSNAVTIQVPFPEKSSATLAADRPNIHPGESVKFSATAYPNASDAQYTYNFGDGITSPQTGSNQAGHTYNALGTFHATVTVLTQDGEQSAVSPPADISVTAVPVTPTPTVRVTRANTARLVAGDTAVLIATLDPPQKNAGFEFDWNDGSSQRVGSRGNANHKYLKPGAYDVVVTAETAKTYNPPLVGSIRLDIGEPPFPLWVKIAIAVVAAFIVGLIVRAVRHRPVRPKLRYVPKAGLSANEISFRSDSQTRSSSLDPFRLTPGMGPAEHTLKFRG